MIKLLRSGILINGTDATANSIWSLSAIDEALLVGRGMAEYVDRYEGAPAGLDILGRVVLPGHHARADMINIGLMVETVMFSGADGSIVDGECWLLGFRPVSGTNPTLDLHNGTSTSGDMTVGGLGTLTVGTYYLATPTGALKWCPRGLYGNLGGTTPVFAVDLIRAGS